MVDMEKVAQFGHELEVLVSNEFEGVGFVGFFGGVGKGEGE